MWLDEMGDYIAELTIDGIGDEVYVGQMPSTVTTGVMIAGPINGISIDSQLPGFHKGSMQLIVRAIRSITAETLAQDISDQLETETGFSLENTEVRYVRPRHLPVSFPRSNGDFYEASVNFDLCFTRL